MDFEYEMTNKEFIAFCITLVIIFLLEATAFVCIGLLICGII